MDVTTVRRRVASLEQSLGLRLLVRGGRSFKLTDDGERVCAAAAAMNECSLQIARDVMDGQRELEGVVRISTMEGFGAGYLAPRMATLLDEHPRLSVQLVTAPHTLNLSEREADVSINMVRPQQGRLVTRHLGQFGIGLYAARGLVAKAGTVRSKLDLHDYPFVSYIDDLVAVPQVRWLLDVHRSARTRFTSTSLLAQLAAVRAGAGIGLLPHFLVKNDSNLVRVLPGEIQLTRDWWLVVHQDLQRVPRIRAVISFLESAMEKDRKVFLG